MKLFHHLLAGSIGVAVLIATFSPAAAQAVDVPHLRSRRVEDSVTGPELVVDESGDSSEFFSGSTESEDGSSELFDSFDSVDDDDSSESDDSEGRRLATATKSRTANPEVTRLVPIAMDVKGSPKPNNSPDTATPAPTRPANATALRKSPKPTNVTSPLKSAQLTALPRAP